MSLSAWEQQALDSIKDGLAGSDPELAALLSAFTRLASDEEKPDREKTRAGSRRALRRLRRARRRSSLRRAWQRLGFQQAALLLWLLTTAAMIAVALALNAGGGHGTCTETAAMICIDPAPEHSPGSLAHSTATGQAPQQPAVRTSKPGPKVPPG
jgi:Protein of unknown function (DUF3040)